MWHPSIRREMAACGLFRMAAAHSPHQPTGGYPMRKLPLIAASCAVLFTSPTIAAEEPVIVKIPRLTVEASGKLAHAAMEACRKQGIQIGVTVVDRRGDAMVVLRVLLVLCFSLVFCLLLVFSVVFFFVV